MVNFLAVSKACLHIMMLSIHKESFVQLWQLAQISPSIDYLLLVIILGQPSLQPHLNKSFLHWHSSVFSFVHFPYKLILLCLLSTEEASKKHPFPCPCTYRTAFSHYIDITAPPRTNVLKDISDYAEDPKDKEFLLKISSPTPEGKVRNDTLSFLPKSCPLNSTKSWTVNLSQIYTFSRLIKK